MDNFEDQDLGGLPILKKETPSQESELGGLPILKKKEPTPLGSSVTPLPSQDKFQLAQKPQDKFSQGLKFAQEGFKMPSAEVQRQKKEQGYLLNTISSLDKGFGKLFSETIKGAGTLLQGTTSKVIGGTGKAPISDVLIELGDYFNKAIDEVTPQDEEFKGTLTDQFAQALGQFGGMVLTGGLTTPTKAPELISKVLPKGTIGAVGATAKEVTKDLLSPVSISAGLSMGQAEFEKAKQFGATDDQAFEAFYKNAAVGSVLEKVPTMQFLKRFNQSTGGGVANFIKTKGVAGITGGLEEMATEVLQQLYANKTAKDIYNINQNLLEGVGEAGGIGFGVGFLINAMGANARLLKREGKTNEAKNIQDQIKEYEIQQEEKNKKIKDEKIQINNFADKIIKGEKLESPEDLQFYENNKDKIEKSLKAKQLESELTAPAVIMPEENIAPEVVEPSKGPAVIMPEENVPAETTTISPEQQGKAPSVIMPEANIAPEVAENIVTEIKPETKSKLELFKTKFAPKPKEITISGARGAETKRINQEAAKIVPMEEQSAVLAWLSGKDNQLDWKSINQAAGKVEGPSLNVGRDFGTEEVKLRDYAAKDRNSGESLDDVVHRIWEDVSKRNPNVKIEKVQEALLTAIRENPSRAEAARNLVSTFGAETKPVSIEEGMEEYSKRKGEEPVTTEAPIEFEGGFVPFEEEGDYEEAPFAVQEATTEEVAQMQDIVKDYINEGTTSLPQIKKAIAKELGYNTRKLRQTIDDAYNKYTATTEAALPEVKSGLLGRVGNAFKKMFDKEAQKPFIAKDGKAIEAKYKEVSETGGRVSFQATLGNGETVTAKPVDASIVNGFYSPLELQINQMKQDKMPAKQWLDKLRGEEAKWTGLSDWLSQQEGSLTKDEVKNWLNDNRIEINEIVKGEPDIYNKSSWDFASFGDGRWTFNFSRGGYFQIDASEGDGFARLYVQNPGSGWVDEIGSVEYYDRDQILDIVLEKNYFENYLDNERLTSTRYGKYTVEGEKSDYKEILITYPAPPRDLSFEQWNTNRMSWGKKEGTLEEYKKAGILYRSNHFDEKNILVHVRSDIRTDSKGNKIYFIEEVQSDWGQEGKKKGFFEDISLKDIQRHQELIPLVKKLDEINNDVTEASIYINGGSRSQEALDISKFLSLPKDERKSKIEFIHNQKLSIEYNIIDSLRKDIEKNNKEVGDKIDEELRLEKELNKYDKFLETTKSNREFNQANEEWNRIFKEIRKLKSEQQNLEEFTLGLEKEIRKANERIGTDNFYYEKSLKTSDVDFDVVEYFKIKNEYKKLDDEIISVKLQKAPFVTKTNDWAKLGLKVALKNAIEAGASKIAWTNGEQQNERYDLSKEVDYIKRINKDKNSFYLDISMPRGMINLVVDNNGVIESQRGSMLSSIGNYVDKNLSDLIGKDIADRVLSNGDKTYAGENLKIGGKGMIGFYGSPNNDSLGILGDLAKSLYKQNPEKISLQNNKEDKLKSLRAELDEYTANKTSDFRMRDFHIQEAQNETDPEEKQYNLTQADYYEKRAKTNAEYEESTLRQIKRLGVEYQYSINITPELKAQVKQGLPMFMANPSGADILGFSFANRMYLNGEKLNPNTIIHEAGHIWTEWTKVNDPKIYAKGMELVEGSVYLKKAKESKFYQQQAEKLTTDAEKTEYFKHEALAMAIGDKGAQFVVESKRESFKDWLKTLWTKIKSLTGFKDLTAEEFQNLTFEEFSKMAVKEILGVENDVDQLNAARSMKKKREFVKSKVRGEANKNAIDDFEVDDMVKLIKANYDLQTLKNIKDAIQKRSAEEVLPSQPRKIREPRGERKRVEPRVEGEEAAGEGEAAPTEGVEKEWDGAITIAANEDRRLMLGLPEYERERQTFEQWTNNAIRAIKRGYNVEKLLDKIVNQKYSPSPEENQIRKIYIAKLKSDYIANPTAELEKKLIRYTQLNDIVNSQIGRQLRSLADVAEPRETLADFVVSKMEANGVDELTEKQRNEVKKQYEDIKKKQDDVEAKLLINDDLNSELLAESVFKEEKVKRKPYQKTRDYKAERKVVFESIKEKLKKARSGEELTAVPVPYVKELIAISPDVSKLMSLYIEEGVDTLQEIVSRIHVDLRNEIDGITEKDIFDVIAGRYKKERPLLSQLQLKKKELRLEAELIAKIEDIMNGKMPSTEKAKIEQNQRLTELRNELRDLKKETGYYDLAKINSLKEKNLEKIKELDEKIEKGDFEKEIKAPSFLENPEFKKKYPKEYDAYIKSAQELADKKHEFEVSLAKDELKNLTFRDKLIKRWGPEFKNTLSAIKATLDNSFIFIQLGPAIWQNPLLLPKVLNEQRKVIFDEGRFRREIVQIFENKELANLIKVSGLDILDPQALRESLREEQLGGTDFLERSVEIKGKKYSLATIIKAPFERIAVAAGNYVRLKLFLESVSHLEAQGKTIETHEKEFKDAARIANELTARGEMSEEFKTGKLKTLAALSWAPKMIGSTLNLLGIGDAYNAVLGRKGYYASLSPELRKVAIGKMAMAIAVPYLAMAALALDDDFEVDYDPRSVTFGQIKQISTGDSWNPYGRFTSIVRYLILMMMGVRYINDEKMRADFKGESYKFFRGKMTPAYGLGVDLAFRQGFDGQPLSITDVAKDAITPLAAKDLKTYLEDDGTWGLITKGLPALSGIKVGTEKQFNQAKQPLEDLIKKHVRTEDFTMEFELKNPNTKETATKEQYNKYVKERDTILTEKLTKLYNGYVITDSPNPVPFVSLDSKQASAEISRIKTEATREAKEEVFGKKKKSFQERMLDRKRRLFRR